MKKVLKLNITILLMVCLLSACSKKQVTDTTTLPAENGSQSTTVGNAGKPEKMVTIKWIQVGNKMPDNYAAWKAKMDEYLGEKIGVHIEVEVVPWSDWENRRSVIVNTNEAYDIIFTNPGNFAGDIKLGAYYDITDMVEATTSRLYEYLPEDYWEACSVNDRIYAVPTYKDSSISLYFVWDKAIAEKYDPDYKSKNTLASLTDTLRKVKEGEGTAPLTLNYMGFEAIITPYDQMGSGLPALGVRYDDEEKRVVSVLEQEDVMRQLEILHQWYNEGIINADAPTLQELPTYRMFNFAQGWSLAAKTTWGPGMGVEAEAVQYGETFVSNDSVRGSMSCISAGSKNPEKALQLLEIVNLDSYVRDAFFYGLEGQNFNYTEEGKVRRINNDWPMAGYTQGSYFNVSLLEEDEFNQWEEVLQLNKNAVVSELLGFNFDYDLVENEVVNCIEIWKRYRSELLTGAKEPHAAVAAMISEMNKAGFPKILEEAQRQVDEFD